MTITERRLITHWRSYVFAMGIVPATNAWNPSSIARYGSDFLEHLSISPPRAIPGRGGADWFPWPIWAGIWASLARLHAAEKQEIQEILDDYGL